VESLLDFSFEKEFAIGKIDDGKSAACQGRNHLLDFSLFSA
jgi:hypothetical protein